MLWFGVGTMEAPVDNFKENFVKVLESWVSNVALKPPKVQIKCTKYQDLVERNSLKISHVTVVLCISTRTG